ncbi:MAG: hypothetical protein AAGH64_06690 [Planctomycetota bacterium]
MAWPMVWVLLEGDAAFVSIGDEAGDGFALVEASEPAQVVGEIVDGKCFLGAMKPGDGKAHKSCAVLCIRGGLPPMVRTRDANGGLVYPLLIVDNAQGLPESICDLVGEPVAIDGELGRIGDLWVVTCDGDCVRPYPDLRAP